VDDCIRRAVAHRGNEPLAIEHVADNRVRARVAQPARSFAVSCNGYDDVPRGDKPGNQLPSNRAGPTRHKHAHCPLSRTAELKASIPDVWFIVVRS
jgi:hypothetical protein